MKPQDGTNEFNVIRILIVLAKRKKAILGTMLCAAIAAVGLSMSLPNTYRARTVLLPPQQQQSGAAALLSQLGGAMGAGAATGSVLKNPNDVYIGMLHSRRVIDSLILKFKLMNVYETDSMDEAREELSASTTVVSGKDGLIEIAFENKNKLLVAPLTNAYVAELIKLTKVLAVTEASQRRLFFEQQLELAKDRLSSAEAVLKSSLDTGGVISVDGDSRAIVETVSRIRAQISAKEIEIASMRPFITTENQTFKRAQEQLNSLRGELANLENGRSVSLGTSGAPNVRPVGLENIKVLRDVKYFQMLYELLAKQYEAARLDEAKDVSVIQILDPAIEPERKYKPKRALVVLISVLFALFASVAWAFLMEAKNVALSVPERMAQWSALKSALRFR